jgi:hypothetical protein
VGIEVIRKCNSHRWVLEPSLKWLRMAAHDLRYNSERLSSLICPTRISDPNMYELVSPDTHPAKLGQLGQVAMSLGATLVVNTVRNHRSAKAWKGAWRASPSNT